MVERLVVASVYPVEDVKEAVRAEEEDVVPRQVLDLAVALQHEELRHDRQRLEIDGERPQQIDEVGVPAHPHRDEREHAARPHRELPVQERVLRRVILRSVRLHVFDHEHMHYFDGCLF